MIYGAHAIIYSRDAEADRAFFRDVLKHSFVDSGDGWLIFALPPAEVAIHPHDRNDLHELYFMCKDIGAFVADMQKRGVTCTPPSDQGWGVITYLTLPAGGRLGVYQPRHASPIGKSKTAGGKKKAAKKTKAAKKVKKTKAAKTTGKKAKTSKKAKSKTKRK